MRDDATDAATDGDSTAEDSDDDSPAEDDAADAPPTEDERVGEDAAEDPSGPIGPTVKSSLLWGLVGGLAFLVLVQGYDLLADLSVGLGARLLVALVVTVAAAGATHVVRGRVSAR